MRRFLLLALVVCASPACLLHAAEPPAAGQTPAAPAAAAAGDYAPVAEMFKKYCVACHNAEDREGELSLERYEQLLEGGEHGAAVSPGKSGESRLWLVLTGKAKPAMPPEDNERPTAEEIAALARWIDAGAKGPSGAEPDPTVLVTPKIKPSRTVADPITAVAYAPGGQLVAVARGSQVELRSAADLSLVRTLEGHRGRLAGLGFSADGSRLAAAAGEPGLFGEVRIWNPAEGKLLTAIQGHKDSLYAVVLSPDGKTLATSSYDQGIKLWDADGKELKTLTGHNDAVYELAFRPDGKILASASGDRTVKLWNVASGERLETFGQPLKEVYSVAFSPDGRRVAAGGADNRIRIWQVSADAKENTNPLLDSQFAHEGAIVKLVYSPDGRVLASTAEDRTLKVWDAETLSERLVLERQADWVGGLAISPDSQSLLVGRLDGTLAVYELASGKLKSQVAAPASSEVNPLSLRPDPRDDKSLSLRPDPRDDKSLSPWERLGEGALQRSLALTAFRLTPLPAAPRNLLHTALLLTAQAALAQAQAPAAPAAKPELTGQTLRGLARGATARVKFTGKNLAEVTEAKTSHPGLAAKMIAAKAEEVEVELAAAGDLPRGRYEVWLMSPGGETARLAIHADNLAQFQEAEPNDSPAAAQLLSLPTGVWGLLAAKGDVDYYAFDAKAGENVVFEITASQIGAKANVLLTLSDAGGRVIEATNDFDGQPDPLAAFTAPAAGRYLLAVNDLTRAGSPEHFYRLSVGSLPVAAATYPLSIPKGQNAEVEVVGFNLPAGLKVKVPAQAAGEAAVPLDANLYRARRELKVAVGELSELVESEPNDEAAQATPVAAPCTAGGRIHAASGQAPDQDLFRFESKAGESWIIETDAVRRGSPVDTIVEVLDAGGKPVTRLMLQATRDSYITFRGIDANGRDCRVANWEEMQLNQFLYMNGEVAKLYRAPQGPDSGFQFYEGDGGKRKCFFDTTATVHALDEPCYVVEPRPAGSPAAGSGLPVFPLPYVNDDDGERKLGTDSRLTFTAPANGAYLVRVRDARGHGGERFAYRLTIRRPRPDFNVTLAGASPTVEAGSGKNFSLVVDRLDGFDGEVQIDISGLPPGFVASSPLVIQAGHRDAKGVLLANAAAPAPTDANASQSVVTAKAMIMGSPVTKTVNNLGQIKLAPKPKLLVRMEPAELVIAPGATITALLKVERNGHDDLVTFSVENLPHGVIVDNIGLNGVLLPKGETERQIFLTAAPWVPETSRSCFALTLNPGAPANQASPAVLLHVRKNAVVAGTK